MAPATATNFIRVVCAKALAVLAQIATVTATERVTLLPTPAFVRTGRVLIAASPFALDLRSATAVVPATSQPTRLCASIVNPAGWESIAAVHACAVRPRLHPRAMFVCAIQAGSAQAATWNVLVTARCWPMALACATICLATAASTVIFPVVLVLAQVVLVMATAMWKRQHVCVTKAGRDRAVTCPTALASLTALTVADVTRPLTPRSAWIVLALGWAPIATRLVSMVCNRHPTLAHALASQASTTPVALVNAMEMASTTPQRSCVSVTICLALGALCVPLRAAQVTATGTQ